VAAVEKAGVRENTLFLFSSDNGGPNPGPLSDNGPYRAGKGTLYEGGVRVAAFATWDGKIPAGKTVTEPMHIVDWYATLVKLCGAKAEQKLPIDGLDVWPTLTQGKPTPHADILLNTTPASGAVRAGNWKLVVKGGEDDPDGGEAKKGRESIELFDLKTDPYEKTNLAEKHPDKVKELKDKLAGYAKQAVAPKASPKPPGFVTPKVWGEGE